MSVRSRAGDIVKSFLPVSLPLSPQSLNPSQCSSFPHSTSISSQSLLHIVCLHPSYSPRCIPSILPPQHLLNPLHLLRLTNLHNPPRLTLIPKQLLRPRIQHPHLRRARRRNIRNHHIRHTQAPRVQRHRIRQQRESWGVFGQVVGEVEQGGVGF